MNRLNAMVALSLVLGCGSTSRRPGAPGPQQPASAEAEPRSAAGAGSEATGPAIVTPPAPAPEVEPLEKDGGDEGGVLDTLQDDGLPPPPPPPPRRPATVPAVALEALRVSGEREIPPDDGVRQAMARAGQTRLDVAVRVCLADTGKIESATVDRSSGYPAYDAHLKTTIEATWRYRPFTINGQPVPVCSVFKFSSTVP